MVPFQRAYLMIFGMMFSILAGNHALVRLSSLHLTRVVLMRDSARGSQSCK